MDQTPVSALTGIVDSLLDETFEAHHGIYTNRGTSLFETLDSVTATEASTPPFAGGYTIAAQTAHTALYLDVLDEAVRTGAAPETDWEALWLQDWQLDAAAWDVVRADLRRAYAATRATVRSFAGDWSLDHRLWVLASIAHSAYHLGVIRQTLATVRAS